jgi:hypothetical protein
VSHCFSILMHVIVPSAQHHAGSMAALVPQAPPNRGNAQPEKHHHLMFRSSSSSSSTHQQQLRKLQQQPAATGAPIDVPQCLWNEVREVCTSSQLSYLAVSSPPVTVFHR